MTIESVFLVVERVIYEVLPKLHKQGIDPTDVLEELGADSVERADIVVMALEQLNLNIPLVDVFGFRTIGELAELLNAKLEAL
jgi:polyketide biosynthesis acyl carrier protein